MALNKLHKKDFAIAVKTGTDANKTKFAKECVQGEMYFATDTKKLYVANITAGAIDATLSQFTPSYAFTNDYSLSFDGSNEYVALGGTQASGNNTFHFGTAPFSVSAWVKPSALSGNDQIVGAHGGSGWTMYSSAGTLTFFAAIGNLAGGSLTQDAWNHCLVTRDGTSFNMYLNGNKTSHTISGTATANTKATITTNIGWDTGSLQPLLGLIDEVATWNVALSDADVTSLYNSGTSVTDLNDSGSYDTDRSDNLVTWYRNGDTGSDATSSTVTNAASGSASAGSSVDGSLQNSPTFVSGSGNTPGN